MQNNGNRSDMRRHERVKRASLALVLCGMSLALTFCAQQQQTRLVGHNDPNATAGPRQSEIIINAENSEKNILVWINGDTVAHLSPKTREKIIVNNGTYILEVAEASFSRNTWNIDRSSRKRITVNSNSNRITVGMTMRYGGIAGLVIQNTSPLDAVVPTLDHALMEALRITADEIIAKVPRDTSLAVLRISSADPGIPVDSITDELIHILVSAGKFNVVEREKVEVGILDAEIRYQYYSGDVDDASMVRLGGRLGASVMITGNIGGTGAFRALTTKGLNVETGAIQFTTSERF